MESWKTALVVLVAVGLGAAIPALVQLRATLRAAEKMILRSGARLDETLGATSSAAGRIDALVVRLEEGGRIEQLVDGLGAVSRMVIELRNTIRIASALGAAVGPVVVAAARAFREDQRMPVPAAQQAAEVESSSVHP